MSQPVDPTTTPAWVTLTALRGSLEPDLRGWFAGDPSRAESLTFNAADLHVDLSKNLINADVLSVLVDLADQVGLAERRDAMFAGEHINVTEDRAVLHTALRLPRDASLVVDGVDVVPEVHKVLDKVYAFADKVRSGEWVGVTGKAITTIVNIGIGGSDLGPVMVYEALQPYVKPGLKARFISNIDPTDVAEKTKDLDPETTLFVVASKTFTTLETLTNARLARSWLLDQLRASGAIDEADDAAKDAVAKHFVAVSTALDKVAAFGIDPENAFGFWDWVGGRYSVDSAIGTSVAVAIGPENFADFLSGFHAIDNHFKDTEFASNVPVLMGLLNVWYVNFFAAGTHAVLPYAQFLHRFAAYLQQLTMESNGKGVRWDGSPVTSSTGEVFWGEPGTNGQHAFYQLIHQGTRMIPADFIAVANPAHPLADGDADVHELFLANFFAQTAALAFGKTADEVRAEGTAEAIVPARVFTGNRPTTSILAPALTPSVVGQLIALYEHITFVQGVVWGIDSFDQWGVELGKQLALQVTPAVGGDVEALAKQDSSTQSLITYYRQQRTREVDAAEGLLGAERRLDRAARIHRSHRAARGSRPGAGRRRPPPW
jgi:glucose-6-phosphate isomerase